MSEHAHPDQLEAHYRRLLAVYPPGHRARYGEEMVDVLMASSAPDQRRPDIREAFDLLTAGLRARLGAGVGGDLSPASRAAATAFGFLASIVLAAVNWYQVTAGIAQRGLPGDPVPHALLTQLSYRSLVMGLVWALVACACVAGLRWVAALGAVLGVVGVAVGIGGEYDSAPDRFVSSWWLVTLTVSAAACLVGASGAGRWRRVLSRDRDGVRPLGWRAAVTFAAGGLLTVIEPFLDRAMMIVEPQGDGWMMRSRLPILAVPGTDEGGRLGALVLLATLAVLVLRLRPAVRRRVLVLSAPTAVVVLLVQTEFQGFMVSSPRFWPPVHLTVGQWAALVLLPFLVFVTGTWLVRRYERQLAAGTLLS